MATVSEMIKRLEDIDVEQITTESIEDTKENILDLNAQQMFSGIDNKGDAITLNGNPYYSSKTVEIKKRKGQPTDRITLKDTGDFYKSLKATLASGKINLEGYVPYLKDITERTGDSIFGLTDENRKIYSFGDFYNAFKEKFTRKTGLKFS